jgi:Mg-chelatase subunit ChlD
VIFHGAAIVRQQLTNDRALLRAALVDIQPQMHTRIDLGIAAARQELTSERQRPGNRKAMVVLTDGRANPVPVDVAVAEADAAKASSIVVFTIGLGDDLDLEALPRMASRPEYFYRSPDGEDLAEIYAQIAVLIPCPAEAFWPLR